MFSITYIHTYHTLVPYKAHERLENQMRVEKNLPKLGRRLEEILPSSVAARAGMSLRGGESHDGGRWGTYDRWTATFGDTAVADGRRLVSVVRPELFEAHLRSFAKVAAQIVRFLPPVAEDAPIWRAVFREDQLRGEVDVRSRSLEEASERASALLLLSEILEEGPYFEAYVTAPDRCVLREHFHRGRSSLLLETAFRAIERD